MRTLFKRTSGSGILVFLVMLLFVTGRQDLYGQGVGISEAAIPDPHASSILELRSNARGFLAPRMTSAQRSAIVNPANGLLVYDTSTKSFWYYDDASLTWKAFASGTLGTSNQLLGMNNAGDANEYKTLNGTTNQVIVANAPNLITLSTPQDIHTGASPTFNSLTLSNPLSVESGGTNSATSLSGSSIMISNGSQVVQGQPGTSTTVLHGNASGEPTYSQIVNADVSPTAAIEGTKIDPDFGSQDIVTTGTLTAEDATLGNTTVVTLASGDVTVTGDVNVSDNIIVGGDVDGRDVSDDGANQDDLQTLTGVAAGEVDLGNFLGATISNNATIREALQELEAAAELGIDIDLTEAYENGNELVTDALIGNVLISGTEALEITATGGLIANLADIASADITTATISSATIITADINGGTIDGTVIGATTPANASVVNLTATGTVNLGNNAIQSNEIEDGQVTSADILDETIVAGDIAPGAVTTNEILDETIAAIDIATGAVTTNEILDLTILNTDVSATAAIEGTKIDPDFGSQDIVTTGTLTTGDATLGNTTVVTLASGDVTVTGDVNVSDNIIVGGDVDGRDVSDDGANQDALQTLTGVGAGSVHLGTFTGNTITENTTIKNALQELETAAELGIDIDLTEAYQNGRELVTDALIGNVLISGTEALEITADGGLIANLADIASADITTATISSATITTADINGGTIDGTVIGATTPANASVVNLTATGTVNLGNNAIQSNEIEDGQVTSADILDETIVAGDIAPGAVTTNEILDETIAAIDIATGAVTTNEILDLTILNTDVSATAAIEGTKIDPDFGSQDIVTSGTLTSGDATLGNTTVVTLASGDVTVTGDVNVSDNIIVGGDVDGRDVSDDGDNQDALQTLTGVGAGSVHLGTFTGNTITENTTIKNALQELETAAESGLALTLQGAYENGNTITTDLASGNVVITGNQALEITATNGLIANLADITTATFNSAVITTADINGGTIDGTVIGGTTPANATVDDLTANGSVNLGTASIQTGEIENGTIIDEDISNLAGINASKIATGIVDNTEFEYLNGLTGAIQTQINTEVTRAQAAEAALQTELDDTQTGAGLDNDGGYTAPVGTTYLGTASSLMDADEKLDAAIVSSSANVQAEVDAIEAGAGLDTDGSFIGYSGTNYIDAATSLTSADELLDDAIKAEETRATTAEGTLTANLTAEVARATAAEGTLTTNLATEVTRATSAEGTLTTNLTAEVTRATSAEGTLTTNLATEVARAQAAEAALQTELDDTQTGAGLDNDGGYTAPVGTTYLGTASSLMDADEKLDAAIVSSSANVQAEVDAIETGAGLDTDGSFIGYSGTNYIDAATSLTSADELLDDAIKAEETRATTAEGTLTANLTAEVARATAAEGTLTTNLAAEVARATAAEGTLTTNLAAEVTRAQAAEADLQTELDDTQTGAGLDNDGGYTAPVGTTYLGTASSLMDADEKLDAAIVSSSATVQAEVDAIEAGAGLDTDGSFIGYSGTNYIDAATSLTSADDLLDDAIKSEETRATTAEGTLTANLTAEVARATAAEGTLMTNLATEVARATAAEGTLTTNLATEVTNRTNADLLKADLASPSLTGTPTAPTAAAGTNTTQIATTAFVTGAVTTASTAANSYADGKVAQTITDGVTTSAPSQDAVFDALASQASYADAKVADAIADGVTTIAPSQNAVFDALGGKAAVNQSFFIGSTSLPINRASGNMALTGITSIDGTASNVTGIVALANGGTGANDAPGARTNLGLGNIDNTSDLNKPVSTATQTALDLKANLASPTLTGTPLAPTAAAGTNTTQIATTAFVTGAISTASTAANTYADGKIAQTITNGVTTSAPSQDAVFDAFTTANSYADAKVGDAIANGVTTVAPSQNAVFDALALKTDANAAIPSSTRTKITYDTKGLVTSGEDATTADIAPSANRNYVTDAQLVVIGNTSNTNTGDQNASQVAVTPAGNLGSANVQAALQELQGDIDGIHPAVTIGTGNGLSLATQQLSLDLATTITAGAMSSADKTKLDGISSGAEVNVNADWTAVTGDAQILNKPTTIAGYGITDAMSSAHPANGITAGNIANWNTAFGWGNHASAGYLTSETDPVWTAAAGNYYTKSNMQTSGASQLHFNNLTNKPSTLAGYGITDAMTTAHPANVITGTNISNWNTAFEWGDHSTQGYLEAESDPFVKAINGIVFSNGTTISAATPGTHYIAPYGTQTAKTFLAAPNGGDGAPFFRTIQASDVPTLNQNTTGGSINNTPIGGTTPSTASFTTLSANSTTSLSGETTITGEIQGATPFILEGNTQNEFETRIAVTDPTDDRTITLPNSSGIVAVTLTGTATVNLGNIANMSTATFNITVNGAADGDVVSISIPNSAMAAGLFYNAWVSADNTVTVKVINAGAGFNPPSVTFRASVLKY